MTIMDYWVQFNLGLAIGCVGAAAVIWARRQ